MVQTWVKLNAIPLGWSATQAVSKTFLYGGLDASGLLRIGTFPWTAGVSNAWLKCLFQLLSHLLDPIDILSTCDSRRLTIELVFDYV